MDLQTRKLNLIEYLVGIKDEKVFSNIEKIINSFANDSSQISKPFTREELIERAKKSNGDYLAGNVKSQEKLEAESKNW